MLKRSVMLAAMAGLLLSGAKPLSAQAAWDAPSFLSPRPVGEVGLAFIVPDNSDWGLLGYWRQPGNLNLGVRAGFAADHRHAGETNTAFLVGSEFYGLLRTAGPAFPVDLAWTSGLGGTFSSDFTEVRVPLGVSAGLPLPVGPTLVLYPYVHPRIGIDIDLSGDETDTNVGFTTDVGVDLSLSPTLMLRIGGSLVDRSGWGIGLSWIRERPVAVASP